GHNTLRRATAGRHPYPWGADQGVPVLLDETVAKVTGFCQLGRPEENGHRIPTVEFICQHNGQGRLNDGGTLEEPEAQQEDPTEVLVVFLLGLRTHPIE